jgi:hypothetical protein
MPKPSHINLDQLRGDAGSVTLDGTDFRVLPIDGAGLHALRQAQDGNATGLEAAIDLYEVAARYLPDVPRERVLRFSMAEVAAVLAIAQSHVTSVEQLEESLQVPKRKTPRARSGTRGG